MSQPTSSSSFQDLFNAALQDYDNQTGTRLLDHPFAKQLEACNSVDSVTVILQEQAQIFCEFRRDDGKIMKSLKSSVNVLYSLSNSTILGEGAGLVHPISFIGAPCSQSSLYSRSRLRMQYSLASPFYLPYVSFSDLMRISLRHLSLTGGQRH